MLTCPADPYCGPQESRRSYSSYKGGSLKFQDALLMHPGPMLKAFLQDPQSNFKSFMPVPSMRCRRRRFVKQQIAINGPDWISLISLTRTLDCSLAAPQRTTGGDSACVTTVKTRVPLSLSRPGSSCITACMQENDNGGHLSQIVSVRLTHD